jgi:hypothetical protein
MNKLPLLIGAICLINGMSYAQQTLTLESQITQKETELTKSLNNSRQAHNTIRTELKELYFEYKSELETQLKSITDQQLLTKKKEELETINKKIENYSQQ